MNHKTQGRNKLTSEHPLYMRTIVGAKEVKFTLSWVLIFGVWSVEGLEILTKCNSDFTIE